MVFPRKGFKFLGIPWEVERYIIIVFMRLNLEQESALVGMILGDGFLQSTGRKNARLRLEHRADHKDYLIWKANILKSLFQGQPKFISRRHPITGKIYSYVRQQSNSSPILGEFRKIFYPNGKKIIPNNLYKLLKTDLALTIWYLDDGYYYPRDKCAYIYLGRTLREEAELASKAILEKFGLENRLLDKKNKGFVIYFPRRALNKLGTIIGKYKIPEVMLYKLSF